MTEPLVGAVETIRPRKVNGAAGQIQPKQKKSTLTAIRGEGNDLFVDYNEVRISFTYNRDALSNKDWRMISTEIQAVQEDASRTDWVPVALSRLIVRWDLYTDEASRDPVPLTADALDELPPRLLSALIGKIFEDINPNSEATASGSLV